MKTHLLTTALITSLLTGCAATSPTPVTSVDSRLTSCSLPTVKGDRGPIKPSLYVVGTFPKSQWIHNERHKMSYKGDGIYQVISAEKAGNVSLQFATMSWNPQFTVGGLTLPVGEVKALKRGGFAKNTVANLPEDGRYVWTVQFSADKKPLNAVVAKCE